MPSSQLPIRDAASGRPVRLFDEASVQWSSGRERWDGLLLERIRVGGLDTPAFRIPQHSLTLQLSAPAVVEQTIQGGARSSVIGPGEISLFSAGATRRLRHGPRELLVIALGDDLVGPVASGAGRVSHPALVEQHRVRDAQLELIARTLQAEAESGYPSGRLFGESLGVALAVRLVRAYAAASSPPTPRKGGIAPARLRRVLEYVDAHLADDLRLATLAQIAGLSRHRFAHNFKQTTGVAPYRYVVLQRIERGKALLRETDRSVAAIAYELGCFSPSRFALLFRRATGASPSAYRDHYR